MRTYYAGGTIGDAYVIVCKLYSIAKREEILCKHYTKHEEARQIIREIYSLLPNINVEFLEKDPLGLQICGTFWHQDWKAEQDKYDLEPEYYPEFESGNLERFDLPEDYIVVQLTSGINRERKLELGRIDEILKNSKHQIIFVGKDRSEHGVFDLSSKTNVKEVISIIKGSHHFYGPQGFLSFVAVSQKIPSDIYITSERDEIAVQRRIGVIEEWRKFLTKLYCMEIES